MDDPFSFWDSAIHTADELIATSDGFGLPVSVESRQENWVLKDSRVRELGEGLRIGGWRPPRRGERLIDRGELDEAVSQLSCRVRIAPARDDAVVRKPCHRSSPLFRHDMRRLGGLAAGRPEVTRANEVG
jgi:hypothetical protein